MKWGRRRAGLPTVPLPPGTYELRVVHGNGEVSRAAFFTLSRSLAEYPLEVTCSLVADSSPLQMTADGRRTGVDSMASTGDVITRRPSQQNSMRRPVWSE